MIIGVAKEIKDRENRVALTPEGVKLLRGKGHTVLVEKGAGDGSGYRDSEYEDAGAETTTAEEAWSAELVVKVKEPQESEYRFLKGQMVFTYFHLAGVTKKLTEKLLETKTTAIAYETVEDRDGKLPLLAPMSAVAGNMSVTMGSYYLAKFAGGRGMQLGTVLGKKHGKVVVIGDGIVGRHAAKTASGMGANVIVFTPDTERCNKTRKELNIDAECMVSSPDAIALQTKGADLVVGAVLLRGAKAPHVVTEEMVKKMQPGSVIVDVSIDQGGCIETSRPTTHSNPVYTKHGVTHYCVTNMPGAYPRTSTIALTEATLPYVEKMASGGIAAVKEDKLFSKGINTYKGRITCKAVAEALGMEQNYSEISLL